MRHLFSSLAQVYEESSFIQAGGISSSTWNPVMKMFDVNYGKLSYMKCRLDLQFLRPGKDLPAAPVNGAPPDRVGILFCSITPHLKAGQRIKCIAGPITGSFDLKVVPDVALEYRGAHHIEVQVIEALQSRERGEKTLQGIRETSNSLGEY